jgi:predicted metal-dependent hydrolase
LVEDPELQESIKPFIGQEAWHARAHAVVLEHLAEHGIDTDGYTKRLERMFRTYLSAHDDWPEPLHRWWMRRRLAVVAALEHYTCVLGRWVLEWRGLDEAGADPVMLDLLRWHGSEEVEHRSLVFDVHRAVGGSHLQRCATMMTTAPSFLLAWALGVRYLMRHDPTVDISPRWRDWLRAARQGRVPSPSLVLRAVPRYLRPGHHPRTEAPTELGMDYLARSPAVRAAS